MSTAPFIMTATIDIFVLSLKKLIIVNTIPTKDKRKAPKKKKMPNANCKTVGIKKIPVQIRLAMPNHNEVFAIFFFVSLYNETSPFVFISNMTGNLIIIPTLYILSRKRERTKHRKKRKFYEF